MCPLVLEMHPRVETAVITFKLSAINRWKSFLIRKAVFWNQNPCAYTVRGSHITSTLLNLTLQNTALKILDAYDMFSKATHQTYTHIHCITIPNEWKHHISSFVLSYDWYCGLPVIGWTLACFQINKKIGTQ